MPLRKDLLLAQSSIHFREVWNKHTQSHRVFSGCPFVFGPKTGGACSEKLSNLCKGPSGGGHDYLQQRSGSAYQKITFTANWAIRGSATWPARKVPNAEFPFSL